MTMTTPVASSTGSAHQITRRKRVSSRKAIISAEDSTAAMARIWIVCTAGMIQPAVWIAWLSGVCSSQAQKLSSAGVRIELGSVAPVAGGAGVVDAAAGVEDALRILRRDRLERLVGRFAQAERRPGPLVAVARAAFERQQERRLVQGGGAVTHRLPLLVGLRRDLLGALLGDDRLDRIPDRVGGRID